MVAGDFPRDWYFAHRIVAELVVGLGCTYKLNSVETHSLKSRLVTQPSSRF
jgi:hypothetical protein